MSESTKMVRLRVAATPEKGFYRGGRHWTKAPQEVEVPEDLALRLFAEPMLIVSELPALAAAPAQSAAPPAKK